MKTKEQRAAYQKAYYLANKEKIAEEKKAYYLINKEKQAKQAKVWKKTNPEKVAAKNKRYLLKLNLANIKITQRTLSAWAAQVKNRDGFCLCCSTTDNLHAHHILPKAKFPHHALLVDNGITLCEPCHIKEHVLNGDL